MDDLNTNSTPDGGSAATLETEPASTQGTVQTGGDATGQGAPANEDNFTRVDPKTLPPQLRAAYDNMHRDYKEKTTKLSETIKSESAKATEAYRQKADFYDQISQQQEFVKQWNEYVQQQQNAGTPAQEGDPVVKELKAQFDQMNQKIQLTEMAQVTDAFAEAVDEKGNKIHPEFDALNNFHLGSMKSASGEEQFSLLRGCIELAQGNTPQEKLANGYKNAHAVYNSIFELGKKAGMGRLQAKAANGMLPPSNSSGAELQVTDKKPKNAHEALAMARRGQMVSRD